jgi:hypothetical protein
VPNKTAINRTGQAATTGQSPVTNQFFSKHRILAPSPIFGTLGLQAAVLW